VDGVGCHIDNTNIVITNKRYQKEPRCATLGGVVAANNTRPRDVQCHTIPPHHWNERPWSSVWRTKTPYCCRERRRSQRWSGMCLRSSFVETPQNEIIYINLSIPIMPPVSNLSFTFSMYRSCNNHNWQTSRYTSDTLHGPRTPTYKVPYSVWYLIGLTIPILGGTDLIILLFQLVRGILN